MMDGISEFNAVTEHESFLTELKWRVAAAYQERERVKLTSDRKIAGNFDKKTRKQSKAINNLHGNSKITTSMEPSLPNEVIIYSSHDYPRLLQMAANVVSIYSGSYSRQWVENQVNETLEHEYQHHTPALDQKGLNVGYGIQFIEDIDTGKPGFIPFISLSGSASVGTIRRVFDAVTEKSTTDQMYLHRS